MAAENITTELPIHSYGNDGKALYERVCRGCGARSIVKKPLLARMCHPCAMKDKRNRLSPGSVQFDYGSGAITRYERKCRGCGTVSLAAKRDMGRMCRQCALKARATHGLSSRGSPHPLYRVLKSAVSRCTHEKSKDYKWYGARGIKVCEEWSENPEAFVAWAIDNGYEKGKELDRINNDGNYEPGNCRFISHAINCRNKGNSVLTEDIVRAIRQYAADVGSIKKAAEHFGIPLSTAGGIVRRTSWAEVV